MKKSINIILFLVFYIFTQSGYSQTNHQEKKHTQKKPDLIKQFKVGIGKDIFSYDAEEGIFFKFFVFKIYYLKLGGVYNWHYDPAFYEPLADYYHYTSKFNYKLSFINGLYTINKDNFKIFNEIDFTTFKYTHSIGSRYQRYYDFGINIGVDYFFIKYISLGYKFGFYLRYIVDYNEKTKYYYSKPVYNRNILNGVILYLYFN